MSLNTIFQSGAHKIESAGTLSAPVADYRVTRLAFKNRMTQAERIAVRAAAATDDIVFDFMDLLSDATYIDLSLPQTQAGVNYLESIGVIAAGRASEILTNPINDAERPK